jgi:imidazolonepropionase-like amidohydrolase
VRPAYGTSLHHELELLVQAGLSTADALRSATVLPAQAARLLDRGAIRPGMRADLVLVDGDPLADIRATRNIKRIWAGGVEHAPAA